MTDPAFDLASLQALFRPRSIAVIGASDDPTTIGGRPVHYLKQRFAGPVYPVNPKRPTVQGLPATATIGEVPGPVDLAILAVPAARTLEVAEACLARGVGGLVVFTAGFAELGDAGRRDQERLAALARASGARVLGPNCLGYCNFHDGVFATFSTTLEHSGFAPGSVGIVSQSGAFGSHCS
jgi:acyl-CoA synthetase (NDP forming)